MKFFAVLLFCLLFIAGCSSGEVVSSGNTVQVMYTLSLDSGDVLEKSEEPLVFTLGNKEVLPAFEEAVTGMSVGEKKSVVIEPKRGYGVPKPELVVEVPKNKLPAEPLPQVGMDLKLSNPEGVIYQGKIVQVMEKSVAVDLNHPLAGMTLHFEVKLLGFE